MGSRLSNKLRVPTQGMLEHWCPGCNTRHHINLADHWKAKWTWDGEANEPTIHPSIHIKLGPWEDEEGYHPQYTSCHYFIRKGLIEFCSDSAHALAGQTVPLPDLPDWVK